MRIFNIVNQKNYQLIIVGLIIFMVFCLNLFLLNKVIPGSETQRIIEKSMRIN